MGIASGYARAAAGFVALVAWAGLLVQFSASFGLAGSAGGAAWTMLRYFTIIANLLVAIVFSGVALGWARAWVPTLLGGVTLAIVLVGVVYWLLLRGQLALSGGAWVADLLLHSATPLLVPLWWLGFAPKGGLTGRDPWRWAALPLVYFGYALARGAAEGRYAYPFMDVARIGWGQTLLTALVMGLGFVVAGFALLWIDRRMAARR